MSPIDRAHATSYSTLIETVRLSCTVFEIWPVICRKVADFNPPTCIWRPRMDLSQSNFADIFGLSSGVVCLILCLAVLVEHRLVTDRHSIASCGKNGQCTLCNSFLFNLSISGQGNTVSNVLLKL